MRPSPVTSHRIFGGAADAVFRAGGAIGRPQQQQQQLRRLAHTVRVILLEDMPNEKGLKGEVVEVKAGHARNHLVPSKIAIYATPKNFHKMGMRDPRKETPEEKAARQALEENEDYRKEKEEFFQFERLRKYLSNKSLKIWRVTDPVTGMTSPGWVDHIHIRRKLSKHLKIDLEDHEMVHLTPSEVFWDDEMDADELDELLNAQMANVPKDEVCTLELRKLGDYMARISLAGGYHVPLKFSIVHRDYTKKTQATSGL
eukprot:CAMPEP_0194040600 /NCGR_PEP_ID=MMETSP0009_2-20130614/12566_1 /TAXON_ID=210454 /ORGANISM="Grammatophora oceanica, Strain CCMP 410" /LENGTH=256 /DNA_ID=CAMNT_0038683785 /DNA_START=12 /DNA_END=782 /DNA_ORIENTATION=+